MEILVVDDYGMMALVEGWVRSGKQQVDEVKMKGIKSKTFFGSRQSTKTLPNFFD